MSLKAAKAQKLLFEIQFTKIVYIDVNALSVNYWPRIPTGISNYQAK